jgi:hypothetical protein
MSLILKHIQNFHVFFPDSPSTIGALRLLPPASGMRSKRHTVLLLAGRRNHQEERVFACLHSALGFLWDKLSMKEVTSWFPGELETNARLVEGPKTRSSALYTIINIAEVWDSTFWIQSKGSIKKRELIERTIKTFAYCFVPHFGKSSRAVGQWNFTYMIYSLVRAGGREDSLAVHLRTDWRRQSFVFDRLVWTWFQGGNISIQSLLLPDVERLSGQFWTGVRFDLRNLEPRP